MKRGLVQLAIGNDALSYENNLTIINNRHKDSLVKSKECLFNATQANADGLSNEFIVIELRTALEALGEIVGIVTSDDEIGRAHV